MAAWDAFRAFTKELSPHEHEGLRPLIDNGRTDLFAARSEEARLRIVEELLAEGRARLAGVRK
jgi:hypothetical protein